MRRLPHFRWIGEKLVACEDVGTRMTTPEGVSLEAHQWGDSDAEAIFYLPERGQGRRRPRGWNDHVNAKLAELKAAKS